MSGVRRRTAVLAALVALVVALLTGGVLLAVGSVGGDDEPLGTPVQVSAELKKFRAREADRYALLVLRNRGRVAVTFDSVRIVSPDLRELPPGRPGTVVEPGQELQVPVRFGVVVCHDPLDVEAATSGGGRDAVAEATVRVAGEPARLVRIPLPQPDPYLRTVVSLDCQREAVEQSVDLRFGDRWTPVGADGLRGELVMSRRRATGPVVVDSVDGSVVFRVEPSEGGKGPLLALEPGSDEVRRTITLRLPWCSPHLLIEAKKAYFFPTRSHIDGQYVYTTLTPQPALRARLGSLIEACVDRL